MKNKTEWWSLIHTFSAKFVLEVMGGGGAIWGFSEACGLRTSNTLWLWRPVALSVAAVFGIRWVWQLHEAYRWGMPITQFTEESSRPDTSLSSRNGIQLSSSSYNDEEAPESEATALTISKVPSSPTATTTTQTTTNRHRPIIA
jgi:hypothetical protein